MGRLLDFRSLWKREPLAVAARGLDDHGEDAGLVAGHDQRDVAIDGHFRLEQLLAGGVDVGGVSERDVAPKLLLDGDARGGVAEGAEVIGVDFDASRRRRVSARGCSPWH